MNRGLIVFFGALVSLLLLLVLLAQTGVLPVRGAQSAGGGVAAPMASGAIAQAGSATSGGLSVSGEGVVSVKPDVAIVQLGVDITNPSVDEAQSMASQQMDAVLNKLKSLGVADKDIRTIQYSIQPQIDYQKNVLTGYRVVNVVQVTVRQIDKLGSLLGQAVGSGATTVQGISFTVDDPSKLQAEARDKAIQDAKAKAEQMAKAAGIKLGKVTALSESGGTVPARQVLAAAAPTAMGAEVPISTGESEIRVTVQMVFDIE
jgi:uncharacterized protein YggE